MTVARLTPETLLQLAAGVRTWLDASGHVLVDAPDEQGKSVGVTAVPGARTEPGLVVYRFGVGLFYANTARFSEEALALVDVPDWPRWFVLLADAIDDVDFTGGKALVEPAG